MSYGSIWVAPIGDGPLYAIKSSYFSAALVEHAKAVPGMRWDPASRSWVGYPDAVAAVVARLKTVRISVQGGIPHSESWKTARTPFLFSTKGLRGYQIEGVRFLISKAKEGALLADGMRLGKSAQSIIAARAFKKRTLIVCPSHVVGVWARAPRAPEGPGEIAKWWPDAWRPGALRTDGPFLVGDTDRGVVCLETVKPWAASQVVRKFGERSNTEKGLTAKETEHLGAAIAEIQSRANSLANTNVVVIHYDILYAWVDVLKAWGVGTLIVDEAHILAGYQSRRSDAMKEIAACAAFRIALTGTPITSRPKNAHNLLEVLAPDRFGYFFRGSRQGTFAMLYCDAHQETVGKGEYQKTVWNFLGRSNLDEPDGKRALTKEETLQSRLRYVMLRRLKKDVDPEIPQKVRQILDVKVPAKHAIIVSDRMLDKGGDELRQALNLAADGKVKSVIATVESHLAEGEAVVCACYRRLFAERIAEEFIGKGTRVELVHGGITERKERDRRIGLLQRHKGPSVLACTIDTTSTGIDLSYASVMVVAELTWEWWDLAQMEERLYKYGGTGHKALVQYIIARGTGDELILRGIISKLDTFERTVGSTGDGLKADLAARKENALKDLYAAVVAMQQTPSEDGAQKNNRRRSPR